MFGKGVRLKFLSLKLDLEGDSADAQRIRQVVEP